MQQLFSRYWAKDCWDITDPFFDFLPKPNRRRHPLKRMIDFSPFNVGVREELKFFLAYRLEHQELHLSTALVYSSCFGALATFFTRQYPGLDSLTKLVPDKVMLQWRSFLVEQGAKLNSQGTLSSHHFRNFFRQALLFMAAAYDTREEYEKEVWDLRRIPGAKVAKTTSHYLLKFQKIPLSFRSLVKRYLKVRVGRRISPGQCGQDIRALSLFLNFIQQKHPDWRDLRALARKDMEDYLVWFAKYSRNWARQQRIYMIALRLFLDYMQRASYPEAPKLPLVLLMLKEDIPREAKQAEDKIKYIPENVLEQLEIQLEHLTPAEYIPHVMLLRASGWRISDILNLRYDACLDRTDLGWYLCGDIEKTQVLNHRIPITNEIAAMVQAVIEEAKEKSTPANNPEKLLFARRSGRRKGLPPQGATISSALNRLAHRFHIVDQQEQIFHFGNHAFRHTKAVELINNGMSLVHVQKWLAHYSPEMTLRYARILDTSMREEWEKVAKQGLFRFDRAGTPTRVQLPDLANEDVIEWEYIRTHLDAVRVPLGYCMKPLKMPCGSQLNPCLTCPFLCTTAQFLPEFERHMEDTQAMIDRGKALGRTVWVDKNETTFIRLESITRVLRDGKTHHKVGKQGREYVGEDQHDQ
jgi:integrase